MAGPVVVVGIFAADLAFSARRLPAPGETVLAEGLAIGPGGKGSNQAVAAARAGAAVRLVSRLGQDAFAAMARTIWADAGVDSRFVATDPDRPTGAAAILVDPRSGENAILVEPGAARGLDAAAVDRATAAFERAAVVVTQLEHPLSGARRALERGRAVGARTILNPAPAAALPGAVWPLCDLVTPNRGELAALAGMAVDDADALCAAARRLIQRGAGAVAVTLGAEGALLVTPEAATPVPAHRAGPVVDTTGAGDAFTGALAAALASGAPLLAAVRTGCAAAGIAVTRRGTAAAMPLAAEIAAASG